MAEPGRATEQTLTELFRSSPNPFADQAARSGHDPLGVDVPTLHQEVFLALRELVERVRVEGKPRIQVVLGDPGEGKTHLLCRLRRIAEDSWRTEHPYALAALAPLRDPRRPFAHLLRETTASLALPLYYIDPFGEQPASQLERLGWLAIAGAVQHLRLREGRFQDWGAERVPRFLASFVQRAVAEWERAGTLVLERGRQWAEVQRLEPEVWRVMSRLPLEAARPSVISWLRGVQLSDTEREHFALPPSIEGEDGAFRVLLSLANCPATPLVLGFDQIEGVRRLGADVVRQLFSTLVELFNQKGRLAIVVLCQTSLWPEIRDTLEQQIRERLEAPLRLRGLRPQEAVALATARLQPFWANAGVTPPFPTWPLSVQQITEQVALQGCRTPRRLLQWMAEQTGYKAEPQATWSNPAGRFAEILVKERTSVFNRTLETRALIARSVVHWMLQALATAEKEILGLRVLEVRSKTLRSEGESATLATLEQAGVRARVHLEASNSSHGGSVKAVLQRLARALASKQATIAVLLREQSIPLPSTALALIDGSPQIVVLWLTSEDVAALAALEIFSQACEEEGLSPVEALQQCASAPACLELIDKLRRSVFEPNVKQEEQVDHDVVRRIEELLSSKRSVIREGRLADLLGADRAQVAAALDHLEEHGTIGLTTDSLQRRIVYRRGS